MGGTPGSLSAATTPRTGGDGAVPATPRSPIAAAKRGSPLAVVTGEHDSSSRSLDSGAPVDRGVEADYPLPPAVTAAVGLKAAGRVGRSAVVRAGLEAEARAHAEALEQEWQADMREWAEEFAASRGLPRSEAPAIAASVGVTLVNPQDDADDGGGGAGSAAAAEPERVGSRGRRMSTISVAQSVARSPRSRGGRASSVGDRGKPMLHGTGAAVGVTRYPPQLAPAFYPVEAWRTHKVREGVVLAWVVCRRD